ncbi:hypothetical protein DFJ63DRAFT_335981 [Scheffersomyces coipomensis]|uniref:uncharacterized protein n=1 Tax=Scheffersomyces coipomensis TaxID=1788519 RepID=UPI00315C9A22
MDKFDDNDVNDEYIYKFFTKFYGKLPIELKVAILSHLSIPKILLLKSLINDDETRSLPIKSITKDKIHAGVCRCENIHLENRLSRKEALINTDDIIPIIVHVNTDERCREFDLTRTELTGSAYWFKKVSRSYDFESNADLELSFDEITYSKCEELKEFPGYYNVSGINISELTGTHYLRSLDFSKFTNLEQFQIISNNSLSKLSLSPTIFEKVTDLAIDNVLEEEFYSKFINLKRFDIHIQKGRNLHIASIPRRVETLKITVEHIRIALKSTGGQIIINSSEDWPQHLKHLTLDDSRYLVCNFTEVSKYKLPSYLRTLKTSGFPYGRLLSQLPDSLIDLNMDITRHTIDFEGSSNEQVDFEFPSSLRNINLQLLDVNAKDKTYNLPKGLKTFIAIGCDFKIPFNNFNFNTCNTCLEHLEFENNSIEFTNLYFTNFTKLKVIKLSGCRIDSLTYFTPPSCLKVLELCNNPIKSIDETCPLFNNPARYNMLEKIEISESKISFISSKIDLPINLQSLTIRDAKIQNFCFTPSIVNHKSLRNLWLSRLQSIDFCDDDKSENKCESSIKTLYLGVNSHLHTWCFKDIKKFYLNLETCLGKKIKYESNKISAKHLYFHFD